MGPLVDGYADARGVRDRLWKPRTFETVGWCVHTTGMGPIKRFLDEDARERFGWRSPFEVAVALYSGMPGADTPFAMKAGPELVVDGATGRTWSLCEPEIAAWHVGGKVSWKGRRIPGRKFYAWPGIRRALREDPRWQGWRDRWSRVMDSPIGFLDWQDGRTPNQVRRGIEVVPCQADPFGPFSDAAYDRLAELITTSPEWHRLTGVPQDFRVVSHSDLSPWGRTTPGGIPWDPRPEQLAPLLDRLSIPYSVGRPRSV